MPLDAMLDAMNEISDEALMVLFANGDAAAARILTLRLTPRVMAHAYRLLGNHAEAEDVAQEAMLRLWRIAPDWRQNEARVSTWLYRVVANLCTDRWRRTRTVALETIAEPEDGAASAAEVMLTKARGKALQTALNRLPMRQRQAVVLRHIEGLSNPEIGQVMSIGTEAVESLTARGKRALSADLVGKREELGYCDE